MDQDRRERQDAYKINVCAAEYIRCTYSSIDIRRWSSAAAVVVVDQCIVFKGNMFGDLRGKKAGQ